MESSDPLPQNRSQAKGGDTPSGAAPYCQPSSFLTQMLCCNRGLLSSSLASTVSTPLAEETSVTLRGPSLGLSQTPMGSEHKPSSGITQRSSCSLIPSQHLTPCEQSKLAREERMSPHLVQKWLTSAPVVGLVRHAERAK